MWGFIGIFVLCCGIYALYSFVIMKVKGEINASILLGKDYTYKKCKDKEAYIAKTAPALFAFGLVSVIYGVIDVIHCYVHTMTIVDTVAMIIFLIVLIWFGVYKSQKQILLKMSVPFLFADRMAKSTYLQL